MLFFTSERDSFVLYRSFSMKSRELSSYCLVSKIWREKRREQNRDSKAVVGKKVKSQFFQVINEEIVTAIGSYKSLSSLLYST